jgi:hypothetical protein
MGQMGQMDVGRGPEDLNRGNHMVFRETRITRPIPVEKSVAGGTIETVPGMLPGLRQRASSR